MADNERHFPEFTPSGHPDIPPAILDAFVHSDFDVAQFYQEAKRDTGKLIAAVQIIAEKFRKQGEEDITFKRGVLVGMLATFKLIGFEAESEKLTAILNLPSYVDEQHTQTDPQLSA